VTDAISSGLSGMQAASARLSSSAHNVANWLTEDFRPERVVQSTRAGGGVDFHVERAASPAEVDLASELVGQRVSAHAYRASLRVVETNLSLRGTLLDLFA